MMMEGTGQYCATLTVEVHAKTVSKEDLKRRNVALQAEGEAIKRAEAGKGDNKSDDEGVIFLGLGTLKQKAIDNNDDDELDDEGDEEIAKQAKFEENGLLDFKGPVSCVIYSYLQSFQG